MNGSVEGLRRWVVKLPDRKPQTQEIRVSGTEILWPQRYRHSDAGWCGRRSSPGGEGGVVDEAEQLSGVTDGDEALHCQFETQGLVLGGLVHWNGTTQTLKA